MKSQIHVEINEGWGFCSGALRSSMNWLPRKTTICLVHTGQNQQRELFTGFGDFPKDTANG